MQHLRRPHARISETTKEVAEGWGKEARKSVVKEAKSMGRDVGPALRKWMRRLAVGGAGGGGLLMGGKSLVAWLAATYPLIFDWLQAATAFFL